MALRRDLPFVWVSECTDCAAPSSYAAVSDSQALQHQGALLRILNLFFPALHFANFVVLPLNLLIFLSIRLAFLKLRQLFTRGSERAPYSRVWAAVEGFCFEGQAAKDVAVSRVGCAVRHQRRHPRVTYWVGVGLLSYSQSVPRVV